MKKIFQLSLGFTMLFFALLPAGKNVQAQEAPVVRAVLFYSNTCPHCEKVITEDLPPLIEKYGDQLDIIGFETSTLEVQNLFFAVVEYYELPPENVGIVPMLVVGDNVLIGSIDIPEKFPGIIEEGLADGGIALPDIPGLAEMIGDAAPASDAHAEESSLPPKLTMAERFALDPKGNTVSVIVLLGMLLVVGMVAVDLQRPTASKKAFPNWLIPALATIGIIAALYLSYVEVTHTDAVCGPVGDCNTVQQSHYATIFGFLPVGVLGVIGYLCIFVAWGMQHYGAEAQRPMATKALWYMAGFGTLFSIYLTFLEPFVIGATCMWCITSAIVQTAIFWLATHPAKRYLVKESSSKRKKRRRKRVLKKRARH